MVKNMSRRRTTDKFKLPPVDEKLLDARKPLPFNGSAVTEKNLSFSFDITELKASMYDLHPIDWSKANASAPQGSE